MKKRLTRLVGVLLILTMSLLYPSMALAATTADVTITYTPQYIAITDNATSHDFGVVATSSTTNTTTTFIGITNTSTVQTDQTISVVNATWTGGDAHTHSDTATPGANTVGMKSQRGGVWGSGEVIVKNASPNYIYENCPATTDYDYGLSLLAPTSYTDGVQKTNDVRISAAAG